MSRYYVEYEGSKGYTREWKREISEVKIRGTKTIGMPIWMINNYIKATCDNYAKLVYIMNIIDIFSNKESNIIDIGISTESVPIIQDGKDFENKLIDHVTGSVIEHTIGPNANKEKYCLISRANERKKDFWYYFSSCERPICFAITQDNEVILLYNPRGNEGIKVCDISYHSPIDIGWGGLGLCLELLFKDRNDRRLQEEHDAKMVTQAIQTVKEALSIEDMLQNSNLPENRKQYIKTMYDGIMAKQEKLNETLGIYQSGIDMRV